MPGSKFERMNRIKAVEREHVAMRFAAEHLLGIVRHNPVALKGAFRPQDLQLASNRLEDTYFVRLFAEFEASLRSYWRTYRATAPPAHDLIESVGARRKIPCDQVADAHRVREWRNAIVHDCDNRVEKISIGSARHYLCHYLAFLPQEW